MPATHNHGHHACPPLQCYRRVQPRVISLEEVMPVVDFLLEELPGLDVAALVRQHPHILGEPRQAAGCRRCHAWLSASTSAAELQRRGL